MSWRRILLEGDAAVLSDVVPVDVTKEAASAGIASEASRQDHKHDISTGVPGTIGENDTPAEGVATSLARSDHTHGSPATWAPGAHNLDVHGAPTGPVGLGSQEIQSVSLEKVASLPAGFDGQVVFLNTDDHPYVYVAA